jgi:hypothetical protein
VLYKKKMNSYLFILRKILFCLQLGESHLRVVAGIKKNAMIIRKNFGNLVHLIIREKSYTIQNRMFPAH